MSRNVSGNYALPTPETPFIPRTSISSVDMNAVFNDIASEMTASLDRNGKGDMLAPIRPPAGSAAAPSHTFSTDTDTGMYAAAANSLGFSAGGTVRARLDTGQLLTIDGALATPALSFLSDANTGIYRAGTDDLRLVAGGLSLLSAVSSGTNEGKIAVSAGTAATGGTRKDALSLTNGDLDLSGVAYPTSTTAIANRVTPMNIPKAWVRVTLTGGNGGNFSISVVSGFNITSATRTTAQTFTVTFASGFANTNYAVLGRFHSATTGYLLGSAAFNTGSFIGGLILTGSVGAIDLDADNTINSSLVIVFYGQQ